MNINIYRLSEGNENLGSINAIYTPKLKEEVNNIINNNKSYGFFNKLCKELNIKYPTFWDYRNRTNHIPLFLLERLEKISKKDLIKHVNYLQYGCGTVKRKVKVSNISEEFVSIIGAYIADGHLKKRETTWGNRKPIHYELIFREGYKSNILTLSNWINKVFDINIIPKKEKNHYSIYISNKIIFRYFTNIFGFKSGRKTETIEIPKFIYNSSNKIKIAILKGILMFDGSVSRKTGYIELYSKSKNLIKGIEIILRQINIPADYICLNPDKYDRYRLIIRKRWKLNKGLCLFEKNTEKYIRLKNILERFKKNNISKSR